MTKKIFEIDPYIKECFATIQDTKFINDETWVCLDQTNLYPEGGGQPSDVGFINQSPVLDVQLYDGQIYHKVFEPIDRVRVKIHLDFERRFDHMQQHSGQHLLSAVWKELFEFETVSFHLGKDVCTIDLQTDNIDDIHINEVENRVAEYIFENRTIESYVLPYDEVDYEMLTKLKEKPDFVRLVEIEGIDLSTCCGTHVSMLGEIGMIKMVGSEKYKQNTRISFVCGKRALNYFQAVYNSSQEVSNKLNVPATYINERFSEFYHGYQLLKKKYQKLYEKDIYHEANVLVKNVEHGFVHVKWSDRPIQEMKDLAKMIIETGEKAVIFCSRKHHTWIFASSSSQIFNVSTCIQSLKKSFGGKGGGNPVFGQWVGEINDEQWEQFKQQTIGDFDINTTYNG